MSNSESDNHNFGKILIKWQVPEFEKQERTTLWYAIAVLIAILMLVFSFYTKNIAFAIIIIITAFIVIMHDGVEPEMVDFKISTEGVIIGKRFFDYDAIKHFFLIYKPHQNIKNLYFEFNNPLTPRLTIPLDEQDPLQIRKTLLKYLSEDLERVNPPISEQIAKILKL